jgi:hypothetical protein
MTVPSIREAKSKANVKIELTVLHLNTFVSYIPT